MDTLEYRKFTAKSEINKAVCSLKGILLGIALDSEINEKEIYELNEWCKEHAAILNREPFSEFLHTINDAIETGALNNEYVDDLHWLCNKFEYGNLYYDNVTCDLQKLQGICHGIIADGTINDKEIESLQFWLDKNTHLYCYYPYDEIHSLIARILADGKVDDYERRELLAYFNEFADIASDIGNNIREEVADITIQGICSVNPTVQFENKTFCFTGESSRVKRTEFASIVEVAGATFSNSMTQKVDYLIVGDNGNPCWAYACYGRKVEKALELRKKGSPVILLHESHFWDRYDGLSGR
jgi:hypothetical protein